MQILKEKLALRAWGRDRFVSGTNIHRATGKAELLFRVIPKESGSGDGIGGRMPAEAPKAF